MTGEFDPWVGRSEDSVDVLHPRQVSQMAATLEQSADAQDGALLPPLWHWLGWQTVAPMSGLGPDGHPARGGFLPPIPLERRMWAGGRLTFLAPLRVGEPLHRRSEILKVIEKTGASGRMVFVTVGHQVSGAEGLGIVEEQDIVYVAMPETYAPPPPSPAPANPVFAEKFDADTVRLFRFSALTFNAHRIHFDLLYAQQVEKYPGLVVHGPMQAMALLGTAMRHSARAPASFRFRGVRPAFHTDALALMGWEGGPEQPLATVNQDGLHCMQAHVHWSQP